MQIKAVALWLITMLATSGYAARSEVSLPLQGFVAANGVRLEYFDWGGSGPALILIHGLGDDSAAFDDLAPAFTGRFHVYAYARRGSGNSDARGPYDNATLTEDLRGLMDALGIAKAALVGASAGGNEITEMAAKHPQRVARIVYLDAAYDWSDPDFQAVREARPFTAFDRPATAMASLDAFRSYMKAMWYPELTDMRRIEAYLRKKVVIQPDGRLQDRTPKEVLDALYAALKTNKQRDYAGVRCPALAIYAEYYYPAYTMDTRRRDQARPYEKQHWAPFQEKSIDRVRREIAAVEIVRVPGAHGSFILTSREQVVTTMQRFLGEPLSP